MDDIFNILFLVGTIIVFIISALRKSKNGAQKPKNNFQSSLESLFDIPQEAPEDKVNDFVQHVSVQERDIEPEEIVESEEQDFIVEDSLVPDEIKARELGRSSENKVEFDLRSAIIYKEILNRKEF